MIATCHREACGLDTGMPDEHWLVIRPLRWNAFTEELTFCSPQCAANYLHDTFAPPAGLLP